MGWNRYVSLVVQKYGGSSVATVDRIRSVAQRIAATRRSGYDVVVVVSAMGDTTDELISLAKSVSETPDRRELDMLVSVGERVSAALLAMCLKELGVAARSLTGSQSGIITDETPAGVRVVEVRPDRLKATLGAGEVPIVAGFQGVGRDREITTLGRGGSDMTAVVLAAALEATHAELLSDVDGVFSADPRIVDDAQPLSHMTTERALTLAQRGANVLYEEAVRYARDHGVAIVAGATFGPGSGTRLTVDAPQPEEPVVVTSDAPMWKVDSASESLAACVSHGARVRRRAGRVVYLSTTDVAEPNGCPDGAEVAAIVTAIGTDLAAQTDQLTRANQAMRDANIAPTCDGAFGDEAWWAVDLACRHLAVQTLHACFNPESPKRR